MFKRLGLQARTAAQPGPVKRTLGAATAHG